MLITDDEILSIMKIILHTALVMMKLVRARGVHLKSRFADSNYDYSSTIVAILGADIYDSLIENRIKYGLLESIIHHTIFSLMLMSTHSNRRFPIKSHHITYNIITQYWRLIPNKTVLGKEISEERICTPDEPYDKNFFYNTCTHWMTMAIWCISP
jgi:hypothetical protein